MSSRHQSTSASSANPPPDGASCWLCLEEGPDDDSGAPLVRDCSCRGHSGFAHLPCLVKYAERRTKDMAEKGVFNITDIVTEKIFEQCPNCKQAFQGNLYYDLTKAQLSFVEREFKNVQRLHLGALIQRMIVLDGKREEDRVEGEEISAKMLSLIDDMKTKSDSLLDVTLTSVYQVIGIFNFKVGTKCCLKKAKHYMEKARDITITSGNVERQLSLTAAFESDIDRIEARLSGESPKMGQNPADEISSFRAR
jgi:hypothetical protein